MNADRVTLGITLLLTKISTLTCAFSIPAGPGKPLNFRQSEWDDYTAAHAGKWRGIWTTYDAAGNQQGDSDRMDTTIELSPDGETLRHVNVLHVGSVGSECSTCFDSVETREIPVGVFTKGTFRERVSGAVYLNGPGVTRRGDVNIEVGVRNGDRRMRCIVTHRPQLDGVLPPSQLVLERIIVVSETSSVKEGIGPTVGSLWSHFEKPRWLGIWRGRNMILDACSDIGGGDGENKLAWREEVWPPSHLRRCRCSGDTRDDSHALLEFDGGVRVEAPSVILGGEAAEMTISLPVDGIETGYSSRIVHAKMRFEVLSRIIDEKVEGGDTYNIRISAPKLLRFDVADLEYVRSTGLT